MPYYYPGQEIRLGDRVRLGESILGVVETIIEPETELAAAFSCPNGGILIRPNGEENRVLIRPYGPDWEDLYYIVENRKAVSGKENGQS